MRKDASTYNTLCVNSFNFILQVVITIKKKILSKGKYPGNAGITTHNSPEVNPNKPNGCSHPYTLDESICHLRGVRSIFSFLFYL